MRFDEAFAEPLAPERIREWIVSNEAVVSGAPTALRDASAAEILRLMPDGMRNALSSAFSGEDISATPERIGTLATIMRDYVREHYLNKEQNPDHTGHPPFSRDVLRALERAWQAVESAKGRLPIDDLDRKIRAVGEGLSKGNERRVDVEMVPVANVMRIYAGRAGDACYTSKQTELARGDYSNLRAWMYATADVRGTFSVRGSVLGLEVMSTAGVNTLVVRANNPKESFVRSVDGDAFVLASLRECIETARRIRVKRMQREEKPSSQIVTVPLDRVTQSSSNRAPVSEAYWRRFRGNPLVGLQKSPESTFKYDLTDPYGDHPCVAIWSCDENGTETWHGDWKEIIKASSV